MTIQDHEMKRLGTLSEEQLLAALGKEIAKQGQGGLQARPPSFRQLVKTAQDWLDDKNEQIRSAVCRDKRVQDLAQSGGTTKEQMLKVVADVLGGLAFYVPVGSVAEILVRRGLPKYCEVIWRKNT